MRHETRDFLVWGGGGLHKKISCLTRKSHVSCFLHKSHEIDETWDILVRQKIVSWDRIQEIFTNTKPEEVTDKLFFEMKKNKMSGNINL